MSFTRAIAALVLTLGFGACSDLPFGPVHGGPSDHLLLVADKQVVRVSLRSGDTDRVVGAIDDFGASALASRSPTLHVAGGADLRDQDWVTGLDVCRNRFLYQTLHPKPLRAVVLSADEEQVHIYEGQAEDGRVAITVASARTGELVRSTEPIQIHDMRRIPLGRAYPDGAQAIIGVRPGGEWQIFIMSPDLTELRDSIGVADLQAGTGLGWISATADGESLYVDTFGLIVRFDLVTKQPAGMAGYTVSSGGFASLHRTLGPEGTVVVADSGSPHWPAWGEVLVFSPDLQQVDTVDISTPFGEGRRRARNGVIDVEEGRIYLLSHEHGALTRSPWKLLVLDLHTRQFIRSIDIGSWTRVTGLHLHPDC